MKMAIKFNYENKSKRKITVGDLANGNIFLYNGTPYMLLVNGGMYGYYYVDRDDDEYGRVECDYFAVELSNGILREFEGLEEVAVITKDLEIKVNKDDITEWM